MKSWTESLCILLSVLCLLAVNAYPQETGWLSYEPAIVTLRGRLTWIVKYGPPGYGENPESDDVEHPIILVLPLPIRVQGDPSSALNSETVTNISYVQLVIFTGVAQGYSRYYNRDVEVTGSLMKSFSGHHHTEVLLIVNTLTPLATKTGGNDSAFRSAGPTTPTKKGMPKGWVPKKPESARLEGHLTVVIKYGAPNYGDPKTDKKLDVPMLVLPWPATVDILTDNVVYVQLLFPKNIRYQRYLDRTVRVTGTLSEASAKEHFTPVVMEVKTIEPVTTKK